MCEAGTQSKQFGNRAWQAKADAGHGATVVRSATQKDAANFIVQDVIAKVFVDVSVCTSIFDSWRLATSWCYIYKAGRNFGSAPFFPGHSPVQQLTAL